MSFTVDNPKNLPIYSYSKIKAFYSCPYYFYQNYLDRPKDFVPAGHGTAEFGTFVHKILELYEKGELGEYELLPYYENHYNENVTSTFVMNLQNGFTRDLSALYYDDGKVYLENFSGYDGLKILESEYEFYEEVDGLFLLNGKVDLIAENEAEELVVIDHKSKGKFKNRTEREEYSRQLYLYAYAVYKKYKRFPKWLVFNMFRPNEWVQFQFKEDRYIEALDWSIKSVREIEATFEFPPNPGTFYCQNFCGFREVCKYKDDEPVG